MVFYFIHIDGKIFLLKKNNELVFPNSEKEFDFKIEKLKEFSIDGDKFLFCEPLLDKFPDDWLFKQEALLQDNVSKTVKKAIAFTTMPWVIGRAIVVDGLGNTVVLKGGRGTNKGIYMTPGGILSYGETSKETALRECLEEAGLGVEAVKFLGIKEGLKSDGQQLFVFFYLCKPISGILKPNMDDSVEAFWMPIKEALEKFDYYAFEFFKNWIKENPKEALELTAFNFKQN